MESDLKKEIEYFDEIKDELRQKHPNGGYVVIHNQKELGVWPNKQDALREGINAYGNISFLVREIFDDGQHIYMPNLGLFY